MPLLDEFCTRPIRGIQPEIQPTMALATGAGPGGDVGFRIACRSTRASAGRSPARADDHLCEAPAALRRMGSQARWMSWWPTAARVSPPDDGKGVPWYFERRRRKIGRCHRRLPPTIPNEPLAVLSGPGHRTACEPLAYPATSALAGWCPRVSHRRKVTLACTSTTATARRSPARGGLIDLAIARLLECPDYVLSPKELATAATLSQTKATTQGITSHTPRLVRGQAPSPTPRRCQSAPAPI